VLKYEDLTVQPAETMARVMAFLGEQWDPALMDRALEKREDLGLGDWKTYGRQSVDPSSVARWKGKPPDAVSRLAVICNPTLTLCGYDSVELEAELKPAEARRQHELGLLLQGLKQKPERD
jgi:hypothetical protein